MGKKEPQSASPSKDEAERLAVQVDGLKQRLRAANDQIKALENKHKTHLKHIARVEKVMVRLDAENTRLHDQLKNTARSDVGILLEAHDAGDKRLRAIARMRGSLQKRPANWYLAHEAVAQAEAYMEEVKQLHFSRRDISELTSNKDVDELLAVSPV
jgi:chromosome segregation ATPase